MQQLKECVSIYMITYPQVQAIEGFLNLTEEWGGHLDFSLLPEDPRDSNQPHAYALRSIIIKRGTFHNVNVDCDPNHISFHTHPYYVPRVYDNGKQFRNPLPSAPDITISIQCSRVGAPSLVFTPVGTFAISVTLDFFTMYHAAAQQMGYPYVDKAYNDAFVHIQRTHMEKDTHKAVTGYMNDMRQLGVIIIYFEPGADVFLKVTRTQDASIKCVAGIDKLPRVNSVAVAV